MKNNEYDDLLDTLPRDEPPPELHFLKQEKLNVFLDCADKHLNTLQRTLFSTGFFAAVGSG